MQERIDQELALLRRRFVEAGYEPAGRWVLVRAYALPAGWNRSTTDVAFQIPIGHPGTQPYGFYVPIGLLIRGERPDNYSEPADPFPPFGGTWGRFSWQPDGWQPSADVIAGSNLLNWVTGFADRFREGK